MIEIHAAAYDGHPGWMQTCIARGDDPNIRGDDGHTALLWSCFRGLIGDQIATASLLVEAGADVNAQALPSGPSCLQLAAQSSNRKLVELLLANGADVNFVTDDLSPLMFALRCREREIASLLLERGADVSYKAFGRTAADYAEYEGLHELAEQIRNRFNIALHTNASGAGEL
jgi:uncharacterized protein